MLHVKCTIYICYSFLVETEIKWMYVHRTVYDHFIWVARRAKNTRNNGDLKRTLHISGLICRETIKGRIRALLVDLLLCRATFPFVPPWSASSFSFSSLSFSLFVAFQTILKLIIGKIVCRDEFSARSL